MRSSSIFCRLSGFVCLWLTAGWLAATCADDRRPSVIDKTAGEIERWHTARLRAAIAQMEQEAERARAIRESDQARAEFDRQRAQLLRESERAREEEERQLARIERETERSRIEYERQRR